MAKDLNKEFELLIGPYENVLLTIEKRLYFIEAVELELSHKLEGNSFLVRNDIFWSMYQDSYKMLIIEIRSFLKSIIDEGGFLNQMNNFLSALKVPGKSKIDPPRGSYTFLNFQPTEDELKRIMKEDNIRYREEFQNGVRGTLEKLFPRLKEVKDHSNQDFKITQDDIRELKDRLVLDEHEVIDVRNAIAHRFDSDIKSTSRKVASPESLRTLVKTLEELLNDFRQIVSHSTFAYNDMNYSGSKQTATDFVELVAFGSINNIVNEYKMSEAIGDWRKAQSQDVYFYQFRDRYWKNNKIPDSKKKAEK